jgi:hypothetical protein
MSAGESSPSGKRRGVTHADADGGDAASASALVCSGVPK